MSGHALPSPNPVCVGDAYASVIDMFLFDVRIFSGTPGSKSTVALDIFDHLLVPASFTALTLANLMSPVEKLAWNSKTLRCEKKVWIFCSKALSSANSISC